MPETNIVIRQRCAVCGHIEPHVIDSQNVMRCPACPTERCGVKEADIAFIPNAGYFEDLESVVGIKPINEMTDRELIEEIMHEQFKALGKFDMQRKRAMVAQIRVHRAKHRIYREAGVTENPYGGLFGNSW